MWKLCELLRKRRARDMASTSFSMATLRGRDARAQRGGAAAVVRVRDSTQSTVPVQRRALRELGTTGTLIAVRLGLYPCAWFGRIRYRINAVCHDEQNQ